MTKALTDSKKILQYFFGGDSIVTLRSKATDRSFTFRITESEPDPEQPKRPTVFFVKLLTGPDNTSNYTTFGTIFGRKTFKFNTNKSHISKDALSVAAFDWVFRSLIAGKTCPDTLEVLPSGTCARCQRLLSDDTSIRLNFGPECRRILGIPDDEPEMVPRRRLPVRPLKPIPSKEVYAENGFRAKAESPVTHTEMELRAMVERHKVTSPDKYYQRGVFSFEDAGMKEEQIFDFWMRRFASHPLES